MNKTAKLIQTRLDYPDDHSSMLNRFKKLAQAALEEQSSPAGPDFSKQIDDTKKLWDLQRRL